MTAERLRRDVRMAHRLRFAAVLIACAILALIATSAPTGAYASTTGPSPIRPAASTGGVAPRQVSPNNCNPCGGPHSGHIIVNSSGKCFDVVGGGTANGTRVQQWSCNNNPQQFFQVRQVGTISGTMVDEIVDLHSGKCLDAIGGSSASGTPIQIWSCAGNPQQHFYFNSPTGVGTWLCVPIAVSPWPVLDIQGGVTAYQDGAPVQLWRQGTCQPNEIFQLP